MTKDEDLGTKEWLSVEQVAEWLNLHKQTVYRSLWSGQLPYHMIGGTVRIRREDLLRYTKIQNWRWVFQKARNLWVFVTLTTLFEGNPEADAEVDMETYAREISELLKGNKHADKKEPVRVRIVVPWLSVETQRAEIQRFSKEMKDRLKETTVQFTIYTSRKLLAFFSGAIVFEREENKPELMILPVLLPQPDAGKATSRKGNPPIEPEILKDRPHVAIFRRDYYFKLCARRILEAVTTMEKNGDLIEIDQVLEQPEDQPETS